MNHIYNFSSKIILSEKSEDFNEKKFMHNNLCILALSIYLTIEQLIYGVFTAEPQSILQRTYFVTALIMFLYSILSVYFQTNRVKKITYLHKFYEISFGVLGFIIAIARALTIKNFIFALPTIYIAVLYGFAVFFYFPPVTTFFIYFSTSTLIIALLPVFQPEILNFTYKQDIISNNFIAWIASIISYGRYVKVYRAQKTICNKNVELQAKTNKIEKTNEVLRYISNIDALTNIYNRRKLNEILEKEYDISKLFNRKISIVIMDVDFFKSINDTFGHNTGDKVLSTLGQILKNNIRRSEIVGRWGGEEFLIICLETDADAAYYLAERIRKIIENFDFNLCCNITCSFGVSTIKENDTLENLINRADTALYGAKKHGRNRVEDE